MTKEIKEIYISSTDWVHTHDNMGGVKADIVFKENMSEEEYKKMAYTNLIICNKDYIINLQEENKKLRMRNDMLRKDIDSFIADNKVDYKSRCEKAIEYIKDNINTYTNGKDYKFDEFNILASPKYLLTILRGSEDKC